MRVFDRGTHPSQVQSPLHPAAHSDRRVPDRDTLPSELPVSAPDCGHDFGRLRVYPEPSRAPATSSIPVLGEDEDKVEAPNGGTGPVLAPAPAPAAPAGDACSMPLSMNKVTSGPFQNGLSLDDYYPEPRRQGLLERWRDSRHLRHRQQGRWQGAALRDNLGPVRPGTVLTGPKRDPHQRSHQRRHRSDRGPDLRRHRQVRPRRVEGSLPARLARWRLQHLDGRPAEHRLPTDDQRGVGPELHDLAHRPRRSEVGQLVTVDQSGQWRGHAASDLLTRWTPPTASATSSRW